MENRSTVARDVPSMLGTPAVSREFPTPVALCEEVRARDIIFFKTVLTGDVLRSGVLGLMLVALALTTSVSLCDDRCTANQCNSFIWSTLFKLFRKFTSTLTTRDRLIVFIN